eukprot:SAG22_NODE_14576_length_371_cov_0.716912_1_plen_85_part_10
MNLPDSDVRGGNGVSRTQRQAAATATTASDRNASIDGGAVEGRRDPVLDVGVNDPDLGAGFKTHVPSNTSPPPDGDPIRTKVRAA